MTKSLLAVSLCFALSACGGAEPVDPSIVDNNQIISKDNALLNGKSFLRSQYPQAERVVFQSDSTIAPNCRYGDGWASGKIYDANGGSIEIKCQTNGSGKGDSGCMTKVEFNTKAYADQEGKCDTSLTSLKKLGG